MRHLGGDRPVALQPGQRREHLSGLVRRGEDIRRLARAMRLADQGIPTAGIERILALEDELDRRDRQGRDPHDEGQAEGSCPRRDFAAISELASTGR